MNEFPKVDLPSNQMDSVRTHLSKKEVRDDIAHWADGVCYLNKANYNPVIKDALIVRSILDGNNYEEDDPSQYEAFGYGFAVYESISDFMNVERNDDFMIRQRKITSIAMRRAFDTLSDELATWPAEMPNTNRLVLEAGEDGGFYLPLHNLSLAMGAVVARHVQLMPAVQYR